MSGAARLFTIIPARALYFASGSFAGEVLDVEGRDRDLVGPGGDRLSRTETPVEPTTGGERSWIRYSPKL